MYNSNLLDEIYDRYNIAELKFGIIGDKLGDCYEDYIVEILENQAFLADFLQENSASDMDYDLYCQILGNFHISPNMKVTKIKATSKIQARVSGGLPKTDVIADVFFEDGRELELPISVKQSTASKVAFAEFDVGTIVVEVGISDLKLISLMDKHQSDASAKNFTAEEKAELTSRLEPYAREFVQWVVTGSPEECEDLRIPKCIVKFDLAKETYSVKKYGAYTVDEYVDTIMFDKKGNKSRGGFGTGLSWTYATGSKGHKIQFKG